ALVPWLLAQQPGVTKANFERIEEGMTRREVEALLGGPPCDDSPSGRNWSELHNGKLTLGWTREVWGGNHGAARLVFNEEGHVVHKHWSDSPEPLLERIRRWLRL